MSSLLLASARRIFPATGLRCFATAELSEAGGKGPMRDMVDEVMSHPVGSTERATALDKAEEALGNYASNLKQLNDEALVDGAWAVRRLYPLLRYNVVLNCHTKLIDYFETNPSGVSPETMITTLRASGMRGERIAGFLSSLLDSKIGTMNPSSLVSILITMLPTYRKLPIIPRMMDLLFSRSSEFKTADVVGTIKICSAYGKRTKMFFDTFTFLTENPTLFEPTDLVDIVSAVSKDRMLRATFGTPLKQYIYNNLDQLSKEDLLKFALGVCRTKQEAIDIPKPIHSVYLSQTSIESMKLDEMIQLAYNIVFDCNLDDADVLRRLLETLVPLTATERPKKQELVLLSEVLYSAETEYGLKIDVPEELRALIDKQGMRIVTNPRLISEFLLTANMLDDDHRFKFAPNVKVGPYIVPFVDTEAKVALDLDPVQEASGSVIRGRHLEALGYYTCRLLGRGIDVVRPDEQGVCMLTRCLDPVIVSQGKKSVEDVRDRRHKAFTAAN